MNELLTRSLDLLYKAQQALSEMDNYEASDLLYEVIEDLQEALGALEQDEEIISPEWTQEEIQALDEELGIKILEDSE